MVGVEEECSWNSPGAQWCHGGQYHFVPCYYLLDAGGEHTDLPSYSTDIALAWEVVEFLRARFGSHIRLDTADHGEWLCEVWDDPEDNYIGSATAATAPLAICRAALAAIASFGVTT